MGIRASFLLSFLAICVLTLMMATIAIAQEGPISGDDNDGNDEVTELAELSVTKTGAPNPAAVGEAVEFTITIVNNGPGDVFAEDAPESSVSINDFFPLTATFVSATPSQGTCASTPIETLVGGSGPGVEQAIVCQLGPIPNGGVVTVTVVLIPTETGSLTNRVEVFGGSESNFANNIARATVDVENEGTTVDVENEGTTGAAENEGATGAAAGDRQENSVSAKQEGKSAAEGVEPEAAEGNTLRGSISKSTDVASSDAMPSSGAAVSSSSTDAGSSNAAPETLPATGGAALPALLVASVAIVGTALVLRRYAA